MAPRQRYLVDFTVGALARRKGRNLALVAVYALIVFVLASVLFSQALRHEAATLLSARPRSPFSDWSPDGMTWSPPPTSIGSRRSAA